jgi:hypothetical protein
MKNWIVLLLIFINSGLVFGQVKKENQHVVIEFINCIKNKQKEKLADKIAYPFSREYPLPDIKNKQEFIARYDEIFDAVIIKKVIKSNLAADWSEMGWRGIMFLDGDIWLDLDGRLIGVNYQSEIEKEKRESLLKIDKNSVHESIREFKAPVCILETSKFRIRIDDIGDYNYRYVSWPINSKMSDKPDIILLHGEFISEGSGGNHGYVFKNGDYSYDCEIIEMGEDDSPPALLIVSKGDKEVLSEKAQIVRK